ncbi:MAG TPA: Wzz/FepE/Etk N-terminal domain-containing protein, partial [Verrucomicrobiae bacterium]
MIEGRQTKREPVEIPALGMKLSDIYYIIFRQKWLIAAFLGVGLITSVIVFLGQKTLYWSEAKLLVRYVTEMKAQSGTPVQAELNVETALNSEMEILTSLDLCEEVAR